MRNPVLRNRTIPRIRAATRRNGCIERFFRTLKEQLLWIRRFRNLVELRAALMEFRDRYKHQWILERLNYRTPPQARRDFQLETEIAA